MNPRTRDDDGARGAPAAPPELAPLDLAPIAVRHADFSRSVLDDLYRYPRKHLELAFLFWALTGLVGGHRFYLERPLTGLLMLCTGGGALIWWLLDLWRLRAMVDRLNADQMQRRQQGLPPRALAFMPPLRGAPLPPRPTWVALRGGRRRLFGDLLVLLAAGTAVGAFAAASGTPEPIVTILALAGITLLGARWNALATLPVLRAFDRWSHRLRLFYYTNDPGSPLRLFFRPLVGFVSAPLSRRARTEATLYLQMGGGFTALFAAIDLLQAVQLGEQGPELPLSSLGGLAADALLTFVSIYAFAAPIGAILTTHLLLEARDTVVWLLTGATLAATALGFFSAL